MKKAFVAALLALAVSVPALPVQAAPLASPEGVWELGYRDSRYKVTLCEGDRLCGTLVWLSPGSSEDPEKVKYLNTHIFNAAERVGERTWRGEISIFGMNAKGRVTQVSDDKMDLRGCVFGVLCKNFELTRVSAVASE